MLGLVLGELLAVFSSIYWVLSLIFVLPFVLSFLLPPGHSKKSVLFFSMGLAAIIISMVAEAYLLQVINIGLFLFSVIIAPPVEELSKFLLAGRNTRTASMTGFGFAFLENAMYFYAYGFFSILFVAARAIGDPALHATTTYIAVKTKTGKGIYRAGFFFAIMIHAFWNSLGGFYSMHLTVMLLASGLLASTLFIRRGLELRKHKKIEAPA